MECNTAVKKKNIQRQRDIDFFRGIPLALHGVKQFVLVFLQRFGGFFGQRARDNIPRAKGGIEMKGSNANRRSDLMNDCERLPTTLGWP